MVQTQKSVQELADQIWLVARELGANIDKIQDDPLGDYGMKYEVAVVLSGRGRSITSNWAVQIFVVDSGDIRNIELVAISEQPSAEYYGGIKISESRAKCQLIASRLK